MTNLDQQIHNGDYGTTFDIELRDGDTVLNPALFTSGSHIFRRPDQTVFERSSGSVLTSSGSYFRYTSVLGDINQVGMWALQCEVTDGVGYWHSETKEFQVYPNLD